MKTKLEILYRPASEFGTRNDVAIHSLKPNYSKLLSLIEDATKDMFPRIVVYVDLCACWAPRFNINASQSTWSRLIRDLGDDADVRCGEVGFQHGRSDGDGFTIYFRECLMDLDEIAEALKDMNIDVETISFYTTLDAHGDVVDAPDSEFTICDLTGVHTQCGRCVARSLDGERLIQFDASDVLIAGNLGKLAGAF